MAKKDKAPTGALGLINEIGDFICNDCLPDLAVDVDYENAAAAYADEENNTIVLESDEWKSTVDPCIVCDRLPTSIEAAR